MIVKVEASMMPALWASLSEPAGVVHRHEVSRHVAALVQRGWAPRFHGGLSTGARTHEGLARARAAVTTHGQRTASAREFRALLRELQKQARRTCEAI